MLIKMAEQRPPTVGEVLELEFSRLRATGRHGPLETQQQKAEFLKLDKASLNRFQNGRRELTRKRALDIARHLRNRSNDDAEVRELADRLLVARRDATADQVQVETWFEKQIELKSLMIVEFREPPALSGARRDLVDVVGRAVARGQTYAMMLPFSPEQSRSALLPIPVRNYVAELKRSVFTTYRTILEDVLHCVWDEQGDDRAKLEQATRRLKLFGLRSAEATASVAIGYRLFFLAYPETAAAATAERWDWVSSGGKTQMIERDSYELELLALQSRFFPLVEFWRARHCLPETSAELVRFANDLETKELYKTSLELGEPQWDVLETRSSSQITDEFLDRIRQRPSETPSPRTARGSGNRGPDKVRATKTSPRKSR
jgi:plasmid maintenance system antidote protein VapI